MMRDMKIRFSLAAVLLLCTLLPIVLSVANLCATISVCFLVDQSGRRYYRAPEQWEAAIRMAWAGPLSIAIAFAVIIWLARKLRKLVESRA